VPCQLLVWVHCVFCQRSCLPGSFRVLHASAADQIYGNAISFSNRTWHLHTATDTWFKDHGIPVLNWPANLPDLNPSQVTFIYIALFTIQIVSKQLHSDNMIENLWGIVKRKMRYARPNNAEELMATIRATWALITPVPQTDRLHPTPYCCSDSSKRSPN